MVRRPSSRTKEQGVGNYPCPTLIPQLPELSTEDGVKVETREKTQIAREEGGA